jgi:hypothetical protein
MTDPVLFGLIDNGVLLLGAVFGLEVERFLPARLQRGMGAVVGAGVGNAVSDFLGGLPIGAGFAAGAAAGCLLALVALPALTWIARKWGKRS